MSTPAGLYVHVPFCPVRCPYCDFYANPYRREKAEAYAAAVVRNIAAYPAGLPVDTVYFGGGTPSMLPPPLLGQMLHAARQRFSFLSGAEITLEVNPLTATDAALHAWRDLDINRLSFGMQSALDAELQRLGRRHTAAQAIAAVERAAAMGFSNISCDLMIGTPGQTGETLAQSLSVYTALPIVHISAYLLSIEPGTPFDSDAVRSALPDEDGAAALYLQMVQGLEDQGFCQYEISNFARPGFESRHNLKYWQCVDYVGIGPAAHSCFGGRRYAVPPDLDGFLHASRQQEVTTDDAPYTPEERVMLGLRLAEGIRQQDFPPAYWSELLRRAKPLEQAGLVLAEPERIRLTRQGFLVSNSVICQLAE